MGTLRYLRKDYLRGDIFKSMNDKRSNKIRLPNENLDLNSSPVQIDPQTQYPNVVFIDNVLDSEVNYTMLYNAKVGTIVPIKLDDVSNMKSDWIKCDGSTYNKEQYPMLFDLLKDAFYNVDLNGNETPVYTDEFVVPKIDNKKLEDTEVVFMIKAKGREKGNYYLKRDNQT
jgi:hypothetical protein